MAEQEETVQIRIESLDTAIDFPVRSSKFCKACKGSGIKESKSCPTCCGSGSIKMLDCIRCNGTTKIEKGLRCNVCKGTGSISEAKTKDFLEARQFCEKFKKNPAKAILIFLACLAAIGICSYIVSGYAFADNRILRHSWYACTAFVIGAAAFLYMMAYIHKINAGSYQPAFKKFMTAGAVIALVIAAIVIPGPIAGRYSWIEREAKNNINDAVSRKGLACQKVSISSNDGDVYHGIATISDGKEIKINIIFKKVYKAGYAINYSIKVEPVE